MKLKKEVLTKRGEYWRGWSDHPTELLQLKLEELDFLGIGKVVSK